MNVQQAYDQWSVTYDSDQNLTRDLDAQITQQVLGNWHGRVLLEMGCGTGKNTPFYSQIAQTVFAFDFSAGMLARARQRLSTPNASLAMMDVTRPWPIADQSVNLVAGNLILEHVADLTAVFAQIARCLAPHGRFFLSELHPFKQYLGGRAKFTQANGQTEIPAYTHHTAEFWQAATQHGLQLIHFNEWWHPQDTHQPPRLISFLFEIDRDGR